MVYIKKWNGAETETTVTGLVTKHLTSTSIIVFVDRQRFVVEPEGGFPPVGSIIEMKFTGPYYPLMTVQWSIQA